MDAKNEDVSYIQGKVSAGDFYFQDLRGAPKKMDNSILKELTEK